MSEWLEMQSQIRVAPILKWASQVWFGQPSQSEETKSKKVVAQL